MSFEIQMILDSGVEILEILLPTQLQEDPRALGRVAADLSNSSWRI